MDFTGSFHKDAMFVLTGGSSVQLKIRETEVPLGTCEPSEHLLPVPSASSMEVMLGSAPPLIQGLRLS